MQAEFLWDVMNDTAETPNKVDLHEAGSQSQRKIRLRDYQMEDTQATLAAFSAGKRAVLGRAATGLGKSVMIAELAWLLSVRGRVMVVVDVGSLAVDLFDTINSHGSGSVRLITGEKKEGPNNARIIVSTVQSLYAKGKDGKYRYERICEPGEFAALLIDEAESSLAAKFRTVVEHFKVNPSLVIFGTTATPFRSDGQGMGRMYDHARVDPGPLNRDIGWGISNGWLVPARQAFVRVSVDFGTLKIRTNERGEKDYSDEEMGKLLEDEQAMIEFAKGIHHVAKGEPSIVIMPTVATAELLSHHLCAQVTDVETPSFAVFGELGDRARTYINQFKAGIFPYLVSVNMLYKGFDSDRVKFVFMGRKTKSRRLYEQSLGRGTRPLTSIRKALGNEVCADARRKLIQSSDKPFMVVVDLVGLDKSATDLSAIDILADRATQQARELAKKTMIDAANGDIMDVQQFATNAQKELVEQLMLNQAEAQRRKRALIDVDATVDVEMRDGLGAWVRGLSRTDLPNKTTLWLQQNKVSAKTIARMDVNQARALASELYLRRKTGLCSYAQASYLRSFGYSREEVASVKFAEASMIIDACKKNGNKRVDLSRLKASAL